MDGAFDGREPRMPASMFDKAAVASKGRIAIERSQAVQRAAIGFLHQFERLE